LHCIGLPGIGRGVFGIELDGLVEQFAGGERVRFCDAQLQFAALQSKVVGVETGGRAPGAARRLPLYLNDEMRRQELDQLFLQRHQFTKRSVEALGLQTDARARVVEPDRDSDAPLGTAHAAGDEVAGRLRDFRRIPQTRCVTLL
jgi:hypothetical protein